MTMTWYRVKGDEITPVEVRYSTEHFVMLTDEYRAKGKRMARISTFDCYFPTPAEAARWIVGRAWGKLTLAEARRAYAYAKWAAMETKYGTTTK